MIFRVHWSSALLIAVTIVAVWIGSEKSSQANVDREAAYKQLRESVQLALNNCSLNEEQRSQLDAARKELKLLHQARREGKAIDEARLQACGKKIRVLFDSGAFHPEDLHRIEDAVKQLKTVERQFEERQKQARREALVEQLGLPFGLLAEAAVSK